MKFSDFLRVLCNKELYSPDEYAKLGPLSDIISAVWTGGVSFKTKTGEKFILPFCHDKMYYFKNNAIDYLLAFDEQFANFFTLYTLGFEETFERFKRIVWFRIV